MKRAADFQSGIKSDKLKACNTATNLNEHMLADHQAWPSYQGTPAMKTKLGLLLLLLLIAVGCDDSTHNEQPIEMTFKKIPAGTFMMGSPEDPYNAELHKVTINKAFYMQTTEVTQSQWRTLMGTEPWEGQESSKYVKEGANFPAVYVSWDDAIAYCEKLSEREGKVYRLPTEAEWEYACRAGTETRWSFGDDEKALGDYAWHHNNAFAIDEKYAHQVGRKKPNAFGLYDMHGNVYEWCHDYFEEDYYKQSPAQDPPGPASGSFRVFRGGSWSLRYSHYSRSAYRYRSDAGYRGDDFGFRLVRELD
jgi:formylglycine-generating enzyme required for sulfatase activity